MANPAKIVLVEDDRDIAQTLLNVLKSAGYTVVHAPNGEEGRKVIAKEHPDLVITDMMMPRMGGFPVLEFLQSIDEADRPKVIMITANEGGRHKAYAEMLGVSNYLRKPFAMDVMLDAIEKALNGDEESEKPKSKLTRKKTRKKSDD